MALKLVNAVRVTSGNAPDASTAYNLDGATVTGYRSFANAVTQGELADDDTLLYYAYATDANGNPNGAWEIGVGTFDSTPAPDTLTRTTIIATSNNDTTAIDWSATGENTTPDITTVFAHDTLDRLTAETAPTSALKFWVHDGTDNESLSLEVLRRSMLDVVTKSVSDGDYTASVGEVVIYDISGATEYNGDRYMEATTGWTVNSPWARVDQTATEKDKFQANASNSVDLERTSAGTFAAKDYRTLIEVVDQSGSGSLSFKLGGGTASTSRSTDGRFEEVVTGAATNNLIEITASTGVGEQIGLTELSVTERMSVTLPSTFAVGDQVAVYCKGGHASAVLQIFPAAGDDINGGTAGAEWSRLMQEGEYVLFIGETANTSWRVRVDGRIPIQARINYAQNETAGGYVAASTFTRPPYDTIELNNGNAANVVSYSVLARRAGNYLVACTGNIKLIDNGARSVFICRLDDGTGTENRVGRSPDLYNNSGGTQSSINGFIGVAAPTVNEEIAVYGFHDSAAAKEFRGQNATQTLAVAEQL